MYLINEFLIIWVINHFIHLVKIYLIVMEPASDQEPWLYQGLLEEIMAHC